MTINKFLGLISPFNGVHGVVAATSAITLTQWESDAIVVLDHAAGFVVTLPTPQAGLRYTFVVKTSASGGSYKVVTADTTTNFIQGYLGVPVAAGTQKLFFADGTADVSVNLNGTTTGGLLGGRFVLECVDGTQWQCSGNVEGSGTVATPFADS